MALGSRLTLLWALLVVAAVRIEADGVKNGASEDGAKKAGLFSNPNSKDGFNYVPMLLDRVQKCHSVAIKGTETNTVRESAAALRRFDELGKPALEGEPANVTSVVMLASRCRQCCKENNVPPPYYLKTQERYKYKTYYTPKISCRCTVGSRGNKYKYPRWYELPHGTDTGLHLKYSIKRGYFIGQGERWIVREVGRDQIWDYEFKHDIAKDTRENIVNKYRW